MKPACWMVLLVAAACSGGSDGTLGVSSGLPDASTVRPPQCSDGLDNDGDGKVDYPDDPGCFVPNADEEGDDCPDGANCAPCSNGRDDDGDGAIDYPADPDCAAAGDITEAAADPIACGAGLTIEPLAGPTITGMLDTASVSQITTTCGGGGGASARAYRLELGAPTMIVATTDDPATVVDTVLDLRGAGCADPAAEVACSDDIDSSNRASRLVAAVPAGVYFLIVGGHDGTEVGAFTLHVDLLGGEGAPCGGGAACGPDLVCRVPAGETAEVCAKPVCGDGRDDDGDGKADYPADPGCTSAADDTELDDCPTGPSCPACANGRDDDGDGASDYPADSSCTAAATTTERCTGERDPIGALVTPVVAGTLVGTHDDHRPSCSGSTEPGGDLLYTLDVPALKSLTVDTERTTTDTILTLLGATCSEPALACDDDGGSGPGSSKLELQNLAAGSYVVVVDAFDPDRAGPFELAVAGVVATGGSCEGPLFASGALTCDAGYTCRGPAGARTCGSECSDGIDNNGDGRTDYPNDPGCASPVDDSEASACPGPACAECSDGIDNDGDGRVDYPADPSCRAAGSTSEACAQSEEVRSITAKVTSGTTVGTGNELAPTCAASGGSGPDVVFAIDVPPLQSLAFDLDSSTDALLVVLDRTCGAPELACQDEPERVTLTNLAGGRYYFAVDGYGRDHAAAFTFTTTGVIAAGASCESPLVAAGVLACGAGYTCDGPAGGRTCRATCSDGIDNDGDGRTDYPADPGCASPADADEADGCPGPTCPACSDGVDNDGDGATDFPADRSCTAASDGSEQESCRQTEEPVVITQTLTSGTTTGATDDIDLTCARPNESGPDVAFALDVPKLDRLAVELVGVTGWDSVHAILAESCGQPELSCSDSPQAIVRTGVPAGRYFVVVDGFRPDTDGSFTVKTTGVVAPGGSCESPLFASGALVCAPGLSCSGAPGARTCYSQCSDGVDNSGDGHVDFPDDPGCTSAGDPVEDVVCPGPACPVCGNDTDDDGDGQIDFPGDFGCASRAGESEEFCPGEVDFGGVIAQPRTTGTLVGAHDDTTPSCWTNSRRDRTHALLLPVPVATLTIDTEGTGIDTILTLRDPSCETELACNDDIGGGNNNARLVLNGVAAGSYAVVVDAYAQTAGPYTLNVSGVVERGTACTSPLFAAGVLACPTGSTCSSGTCR